MRRALWLLGLVVAVRGTAQGDQQPWRRDMLAAAAAKSGDLEGMVRAAPARAANLCRDLLRLAARSQDKGIVQAAAAIAAAVQPPAARVQLQGEVQRWQLRGAAAQELAVHYEDAMERAQRALVAGNAALALSAGDAAWALAERLGEPYLSARAASVRGAAHGLDAAWEPGIAELETAVAREAELFAFCECLADREQLAVQLERRAALRNERGDYQRSLDDLLRALDQYRLVGRPDPVGRLLVTLGGAFGELARFVDAEDMLQQALELLSDDTAARGRALAALGLCWSDQGRYREAAPILLQARALAERNGDRWGMQAANRFLATVWLETGRLDLAERALASVLDEPPDDRLVLALAWTLRGEVAGRAGREDAARAHFARALEAGEALPEGCWRAQSGLGRLVEATDPAAARRHFAAAVEDLEHLRTQLRLPAMRATALAERRRPYLGTARLAAAAGDLDAAFAALESLHARSLWEVAAGPTAAANIAGDRDLVELELELRRCDEALAAAAVGERPQLLQRRAALRGQHERLSVRRRLADERREVLAGRAPIAMADAQRQLAATDALLVYGIDRDAGLCLVLRPDAVHPVTLPTPAAAIEAQVRSLLQPMRDLATGAVDAANLQFAAGAARTLYQQLIAPLPLAGAERLWIVADGPLRQLPFALLVAQREVRPVDPGVPYAQYGGCHYLVEDFELAQLPAAALLQVGARPAGGEGGALVFGCAPAAGGLPGASAEATAVAAACSVAPFTGSATALREALAHSRIVHLATHAELDAARPAYSRLDLRGDGSSDGWLCAYEVADLQLPGSLVVLSGCDTAGVAGAGDGLFGLTRAFLAAGARAVVATGWQVADRASAVLMVDFHRRCAAGDPVRALARAQRAMLADGRRAGTAWSHPYFWAGYAIHGRP